MLILTGLVLLAATGAGATVTFQGTNTTVGQAASFPLEKTVEVDSNLLVVEIGTEKGTTISSVDFNGTALTELASVSNGGKAGISMWYLTDPAVGTGTVSVTMASSDRFSAAASTFSGVKVTDPTSGLSTATGTSFEIATTVTSEADDLVIDAVAADEGPISPGTGQTERWNRPMGGQTRPAGGSYEAGAASVSMDWSIDKSKEWSIIGVSLNHDDPPAQSYVAPTPADGTFQQHGFVYINTTVSDDVGLETCSLDVDGTSESMTRTGTATSGICYKNVTGLNEGVHTFQPYVNDTLGQVVSPGQRTVTVDQTAPAITLDGPTNNSQDQDRSITFNATVTDKLSPSSQSCSLYLDGSLNQTVSNVANNSQVSFPVAGIVEGNHTWYVECTDRAGNTGRPADPYWFEADYTPDLGGVTASPSPIKGGDVINVSASGVADPNGGTLEYVCSEETTEPTPSNTLCTGGNTVGSNTSSFFCTYATNTDTATHTTNCRIVDQDGYYSATQSTTYETDSTPPSISVSSIAGDAAAPFYDSVDDSVSSITVNGEANMTCRWSSSDIGFSSMTNGCTTSGSSATCDINDVTSQGGKVRYIACRDELGNAQTASENLQASFVLDYTEPTTFDNATAGIKVPPYIINITEQDNVDHDPQTLYCIDQSNSCIPDTAIDDGGTVTFGDSLRGTNYFRYASTDDADNTGSRNTTVDINELPSFSAASDNATTVGDGKLIKITTNAVDPDSQNLTLRVCDAAGADATGCTTGTELCSATASTDPSCTFQSQSTSGDYQWYAYIYDSLNEAAPSNPRNGSYTVDATAPTITITDPENKTYGQSDIPAKITLDEAGHTVYYELFDGPNATGTNVTMDEIDSTTFAKTLRGLQNGQHGIRFWANDSYGNTVQSQELYFTVNDTLNDTTAPTLTIASPTNNSFHNSTVFLNVSTDEEVTSMDYSLDNKPNTSMGNTSFRDWNETLPTNISQGHHNITFWASDRAGNIGRSAINRFTYDTVAPQYVNVSVEPANASDANDATCSIDWTDNVELDSAVIGHNATDKGSFSNKTYQLSGTAGSASRTIPASKLEPGGVQCRFWGFDTTGNRNKTALQFPVTDGTPPTVENLTFSPSDAESLDPGVRVTFEVDVLDAGGVDGSSVTLQYDDNAGNVSNISMTGVGGNTFQANLTFGSEANWTVRAFADDTAGNTGSSVKDNVSVFHDNRFTVTDTLPDTKARVVNEDPIMVFGNITLNNTGDQALDIEVTSDLLAVRFAGVQNQSITRSVAAGATSTFNVTANTTDFSVGQYPFTITMNATRNGTAVDTRSIDSEIVIQNVAGPLMRIEIEEFSSNVNSGQSRVRYKATAENIGTEAADEGWLTWALPSQFTLRSGQLNVTESPMVIGGSVTNNILIDVKDVEDQNVTITSRANATAALGDLEERTVTIGQPQTVVRETDGGGNDVAIIERPPSTGTEREILQGRRILNSSREIHLVRGEESSFTVQVQNIFENTTIYNATLRIEGFLAGHVRVRPAVHPPIPYQREGVFTVNITSPSYLEPGRHRVTAIVTGDLKGPYIDQELISRRVITLIVHTVSREQANTSLTEAGKIVASMRQQNFSTSDLTEMVQRARTALREQDYDTAYSIARRIEELRRTAEQYRQQARSVRRAIEAAQTATGEYLGYTQSFPQTQQLLRLARAAADRGDYDAALSHAQQAELTFQSERKEFHALFFLFRYWQELVLGAVAILLTGYLGLRFYRRRRITRRIRQLNAQEEKYVEMMRDLQQQYYGDGDVGKATFQQRMDQYQERISEIRQDRTEYRHKRVRILNPDDVAEELQEERATVVDRIEQLQEQYFEEDSISKPMYERQVEAFRERLTEIEQEQMELRLRGVVEG